MDDEKQMDRVQKIPMASSRLSLATEGLTQLRLSGLQKCR